VNEAVFNNASTGAKSAMMVISNDQPRGLARRRIESEHGALTISALRIFSCLLEKTFCQIIIGHLERPALGPR
jgi:hypothetical protein